jgi:hypothetical protein
MNISTHDFTPRTLFDVDGIVDCLGVMQGTGFLESYNGDTCENYKTNEGYSVLMDMY